MRIGGASPCVLLAAALLGVPHGGRAQSVSIGGAVERPSSISLSDVESLPATTIEVGFQTGHGPEHHSWTGATLWAVLAKVGLTDAANARAQARHSISVKGHDGYAVTLSMGEIAPDLEGKSVLLAYRQDGQPIAPAELRLVVPGDKHGARAVRDVVAIEVR
jgi:DMSO/TMAO reductase YedYZ molybdopterin-dependent catalytic subunit